MWTAGMKDVGGSGGWGMGDSKGGNSGGKSVEIRIGGCWKMA